MALGKLKTFLSSILMFTIRMETQEGQVFSRAMALFSFSPFSFFKSYKADQRENQNREKWRMPENDESCTNKTSL
jgi:hypothetical protein